MPWNLTTDRPIYNQIIDRVAQDIISGHYQPGEKLPSVRELAAEAAVNPNTMQKALSELERTGLVNSMRTSGRFITEDQTLIEREKNRLAAEEISQFLQKMKGIGLQSEQILELVKQEIGKEGESV